MADKNFGRLSFWLWLNNTEAEQVMEAILDQFGKPIGGIDGEDDPYSLARSKFEKEDDQGQVCLTGYQGYKEHNPMLQAFAQQNAENFAQTVMFGPLTANTPFARFNEWFPVLMQFLRQRDQVSREEVANFISGVGGKKANVARGGFFASVLDRGEGMKTELISMLWNDRQNLYQKAMKMADENRWEDMMVMFSSLPGVQPVKAGFMVQLAFGQLGCIDTHNVAMYRSVAKLMLKDPSVEDDEKEKWQDLLHKMPQKKKRDGSKTPVGEIPKAWQGGGRYGSDKTEKAVQTYMDVLKHMNNEMGITPRVLWDFWVNYVSQRYEASTDNQYSKEQGTSYAPDDPQLMNVLGGKDRQWQRERGGRSASVIEPHASSGGVSRVHMMAAITPADLLSQLQTNLGNKYHVINSALRGDKDGAPALATLSARMMDQAKVQALMNSGGNINPAMRHAKTMNDDRINKLRENAEKALYWLLTNKYGLRGPEARELLSIYTGTLEKLYHKHIREIMSGLKGAATRRDKKAGTYVYDDEEMGHNVDTYDLKKPFDPKSYGERGSKIGRLEKSMQPYVAPMQRQNATRISMEREERKRKKAIEGLMAKLVGTDEQPGPKMVVRDYTIGGKQSRLSKAKAKFARTREAWEAASTKRPTRQRDIDSRTKIRDDYQAARKEYLAVQKAHDTAAAQVTRLEDKIRTHQEAIRASQEEFKGVEKGVKRQAGEELRMKSAKARDQLHGKTIYDTPEEA